MTFAQRYQDEDEECYGLQPFDEAELFMPTMRVSHMDSTNVMETQVDGRMTKTP